MLRPGRARLAILRRSGNGGPRSHGGPAHHVPTRIKAVATVSGADMGSVFRNRLTGGQDPAVRQAMLVQSAVLRTGATSRRRTGRSSG
jgi:hypothetical protein